jgi:hypothetical protein
MTMRLVSSMTGEEAIPALVAYFQSIEPFSRLSAQTLLS